ncbi:MAG: hypothetical protein HYU51_12795 [Candidatus Rokubacteria bacterium]|nr:hypothetical protein [Candidatus Rokubacteria bacterium]
MGDSSNVDQAAPGCRRTCARYTRSRPWGIAAPGDRLVSQVVARLPRKRAGAGTVRLLRTGVRSDLAIERAAILLGATPVPSGPTDTLMPAGSDTSVRNFHLPLPEPLYRRLREAAAQTNQPATTVARYAIEA